MDSSSAVPRFGRHGQLDIVIRRSQRLVTAGGDQALKILLR
jgi:hypothetical protein